MNSIKIVKGCSLLLAALVLLSCFCVSALATEEGAVNSGDEDNEVIHAEYNPDDWMMAGSAVFNSIESANSFQLTAPVDEWQSGAIWYNYSYTGDFTIELDYYIGDGGSGANNGADGMTIAFYTNFGFTLAQGGALGYSGFGGYAIELDTHYNSENSDPNYNHIALLQDNVKTHLVTASLSECEDQLWHKLKLVVEGNTIEVYIDGSEDPRIRYEAEAGLDSEDGGWLGITAATGDLYNNHSVRNIEITGKRSAAEKFFDVSLSHQLVGEKDGVYEYQINAAITNNAPKAAPDVTTALTLSSEIRLSENNSLSVNVGDISGKETKNISWTVYVDCPIDKADVEASYSTSATIKGINTEFKNEGTLIAKHKNTLSFNANGGSGDMADLLVYDGKCDLPLPEFTAPDGYMFYGWSESADGDIVANEDYEINEKTTLYAIWKESATVTFDSNGGSGEMDSKEMFLGNIELPECDFGAPSNKMFKGWSPAPNGELISGGQFNLSKDVTLYAIWETYYTVNISNGGGVDDYILLDKVFGGEMILPECTLTAPDGYTFGGWSYSDDGEIIQGGKITVSDNTVLYPVWLKICEVTFDANGGGGEMESKTLTEGEYDLFDCEFTAPEGYLFKGWSLSSDGELLEEIVLEDNLTLYAIWESYYTVSFNANGGSGNMDDITVIGDDKIDSVSCGFIAPDKHIFKGWSTDADGEIIDSFDFNESLTLYAIWERVYTVSFDANGGQGEMKPLTGLTEGKILMPACTFTAPDNYKIKGWSLTPDGEIISGEMVTIDSDITLYAIWEEIPEELPDGNGETEDEKPEEDEKGFLDALINFDLENETLRNILIAVAAAAVAIGVIVGIAVIKKRH